MNLILKGRGVKLDDRLRGYATDKLTRVERFFERIIKMEIELRSEHAKGVADRHRVDVTVKTPGETLVAHGYGQDHFAAIDQAADRLETQVKKHKDRLNDHHRPPRHAPNGPAAATDDDDLGDDGPRIRLVRQPPAKPMTAEEAVMELDARGLSFLLFTDADSMQAAVLYRRTDGGYGVVQHEV